MQRPWSREIWLLRREADMRVTGCLARSCRLRRCPRGCELPRVADKKQDPDGYTVQVIANANGGREVGDYRQLLAPLPR